MKKYLIPLTLSFWFLASAMETEKSPEELFNKIVNATYNKQASYWACTLRYYEYYHKTNPAYSCVKSTTFTERVINTLSKKFDKSTDKVSRDLKIVWPRETP